VINAGQNVHVTGLGSTAAWQPRACRAEPFGERLHGAAFVIRDPLGELRWDEADSSTTRTSVLLADPAGAGSTRSASTVSHDYRDDVPEVVPPGAQPRRDAGDEPPSTKLGLSPLLARRAMMWGYRPLRGRSSRREDRSYRWIAASSGCATGVASSSYLRSSDWGVPESPLGLSARPVRHPAASEATRAELPRLSRADSYPPTPLGLARTYLPQDNPARPLLIDALLLAKLAAGSEFPEGAPASLLVVGSIAIWPAGER
jgi:hypothetical protein